VDEAKEDDFTQVEFSMNFLIEQLRYERDENKRKQTELEEKIDTIRKQQEAILELSTPNIKVWEGVLVIPIIGTLDTRRSQRLTEELLTKIGLTQSKVALIDITGVPTVDSAVANHILKTVAAVQLLGAECVITGIRPEVAQTIVHLGVNLSGVETLSNLAEGLKWALKRLRLKIIEDKNG
jgi:rsbT co-antagonist protein RsbR